eukprot:SAG31_NODE_3728_length_3948_cov_1.597504_7_plen_182_part_00
MPAKRTISHIFANPLIDIQVLPHCNAVDRNREHLRTGLRKVDLGKLECQNESSVHILRHWQRIHQVLTTVGKTFRLQVQTSRKSMRHGYCNGLRAIHRRARDTADSQRGSHSMTMRVWGQMLSAALDKAQGRPSRRCETESHNPMLRLHCGSCVAATTHELQPLENTNVTGTGRLADRSAS